MSKCNSLFQDQQEANMRQRYQEYIANLDEGETPMTIEQFLDDECCQADYQMMTREP